VVHKEESVDIVDMPVFAASDKAHWDNFLPLAIIVFKPAFLQSAIRYQAPPTESDITWFGPLNHKPSRKSVALNVWMEGAEAFVAGNWRAFEDDVTRLEDGADALYKAGLTRACL
jgi:hypothetical protein